MPDDPRRCLYGIGGDVRCTERCPEDEARAVAAGWVVQPRYCICPAHAAATQAHAAARRGPRTPDWRRERDAVDERWSQQYDDMERRVRDGCQWRPEGV